MGCRWLLCSWVAITAASTLLLSTTTVGFSIHHNEVHRGRRQTKLFTSTSSSISSSLLDRLEQPDADTDHQVRSWIQSLEEKEAKDSATVEDGYTMDDDDPNRLFEPVVGLYNVSLVQTKKAGENPVGGKWTRKSGLAQKLLRTRRTLQHVLKVNSTGIGATFVAEDSKSNSSNRAVVAEAINVIALEALWGKIRATVILRGDCIVLNATERAAKKMCQPLSPLAVRVLFDAPRLALGRTGRWFNINLGPKSSVVLDTTYVDSLLRIGLGGRSGTRFVFARCRTDDHEASEYRGILARRAWGKRNILVALSGVFATGIYSALVRGCCTKLGWALSTLSMGASALVAFSSGGIEQDTTSSSRN